jgi:hypothetical protein
MIVLRTVASATAVIGAIGATTSVVAVDAMSLAVAAGRRQRMDGPFKPVERHRSIAAQYLKGFVVVVLQTSRVAMADLLVCEVRRKHRPPAGYRNHCTRQVVALISIDWDRFAKAGTVLPPGGKVG